ncbi:MAG: tRNA pseudouridine(38-40) synthase TruA [Chthoniobacteraceae bacterium]
MRLKLVIAYDGRPFRGWQSQEGGDTVQDHLEKAFGIIDGNKVSVQGSCRTDAGVHALGQVAHVELQRTDFTPEAWCRAVNAHLPFEIRLLRASRCPANFHARFDAQGKTYRYRLWCGPVHHPLEIGRSWHVPIPLDPALLRECAQVLGGQHDFRGFSANRGKPDHDTVRTISDIRLKTAGPLIELTFTGDGFLYKMVRLLTGSMVRVAQGRAPLTWLQSILQGEARTSFAAPAEGLYLARVFYGTVRK